MIVDYHMHLRNGSEEIAHDTWSVDPFVEATRAVAVDEAWRRYFDTLARAARSGLFDSLSHPDLVKIFGDRPEAFDYGPVVDAIAESAVGV